MMSKNYTHAIDDWGKLFLKTSSTSSTWTIRRLQFSGAYPKYTIVDASNGNILSRGTILSGYNANIFDLSLSSGEAHLYIDVDEDGNSCNYIDHPATATYIDFTVIPQVQIIRLYNNVATIVSPEWTALREVTLYKGNYTGLDFSMCTTLTLFRQYGLHTYLDIPLKIDQNNSLTFVKIESALGISEFNTSAMANLTYLKINRQRSSGFASLDLSSNLAIWFIDLHYNALTTLTLPQTTSLRQLSVKYNYLTTLDLTGISNITVLNFQQNPLLSSIINLSSQTSLSTLYGDHCSLNSLDLTNSLSLGYLDVDTNHLTTLDLSNNSSLYNVDVHNNDLTELNMKNGNNTNISVFYAAYNELTCILVDDAVYSTDNWTSIDSGVSFNEVSCP